MNHRPRTLPSTLPSRSTSTFAARSWLLAATLLVAVAAPAQRMAVPGEPGRMLQLFDLHRLYADGTAPDTTTSAEETAELLRSVLTRPLTHRDDVRALGSRWIAVLGDAEQIAEVERLMAAAQKRRDDFVEVQVQLLDVEPGRFVRHVADHLVRVERGEGVTYETVVAEDKAKAFLADLDRCGAERVFAPKLSTRPLQPATVSVQNQVAYVKDFKVARDGENAIADPIVDVAWEGNKSELMATFLPGGNIGLRCDVHVQELHRPIAEAKVQVIEGALPMTIQLPRTSGVRMRNVAEVAPGALVVLAAQRAEGTYLVAVIKATAVSIK